MSGVEGLRCMLYISIYILTIYMLRRDREGEVVDCKLLAAPVSLAQQVKSTGTHVKYDAYWQYLIAIVYAVSLFVWCYRSQ